MATCSRFVPKVATDLTGAGAAPEAAEFVEGRLEVLVKDDHDHVSKDDIEIAAGYPNDLTRNPTSGSRNEFIRC